jgi:hypothetical protein
MLNGRLSAAHAIRGSRAKIGPKLERIGASDGARTQEIVARQPEGKPDDFVFRPKRGGVGK